MLKSGGTDAPVRGCFLCGPDQSLVYAGLTSTVALCGLGPIVDGYTVLATRGHLRSCADAVLVNDELSGFTQDVRLALIGRYGSCVMTEHGRLPVCARPTGAEEHCFHAHFLLFPAVQSIVDSSRVHFEESTTTSTLMDALEIARERPEYFLVSPTPHEFVVMCRPRNVMRQFARYMVAEAIGKPERADWVQYPERARAERDAAELRLCMPEHLRILWTRQK
jgi:hypothetical protein